MTNTVTVNGNTYNDGTTGPNNMGNGGFRSYLLPMLSDAVVDLGAKQTAAQAAATSAAASANLSNNAVAIAYTFSTTTTDSDPGNGTLRLDNATQNSATTIRADLQDSNGTSWSATLATFAASTSSNKGQIRLVKIGDSTKYLTFNVTALATPSGYDNISVTNIGSSTASPFANGDAIALIFSRTGDKGDTGATGAAGTLGGTATSTVELLTGSNIASASTVNLDTATGNRVHITGTTTITAVTLTRGPRTVIFDGALTLTHNATTNNLPGAANITAAAGDRAIYESDGTTVYCVAYIKKDGTPVVTGSAANGWLDVCEQQASGTNSVDTSLTGSTFTTRTLNTVVTNTIPSASLSANAFTLPAGTYRIRAKAPGTDSTSTSRPHMIALHNGSSYVLTGTSELQYGPSVNVSSSSFISGQFTIGSSTTFTIKHWTNSNNLTGGRAVSSGQVETYT